MSRLARITADPSICRGERRSGACDAPFSASSSALCGHDDEDLLADYPDLDRDDILAALKLVGTLSFGRELRVSERDLAD